MKISKLQKFAWVFFALVLGTTSLFAQGFGNRNRAFAQNNQNYSCVNSISELTEDQVTDINNLQEEHWEAMAGLREKMWAATSLEEKNAIRDEMLESVVSHRSAVKQLLSEEQQKEFDISQLRGNGCRNQGTFGQRRGNGSPGAGFGRGNNRGNRSGRMGNGNGLRAGRGFNNRGLGICPWQ